MESYTFLTSDIEQGMLCPRRDGSLDLYLIKKTGRMILSCRECEATCYAPEPQNIGKSEKLFPDILGLHTQLSGFAQELEMSAEEFYLQMVRILNHRLFTVPENQFSELILEAWHLVEKDSLHKSRLVRSVAHMDREIGINGEANIYLESGATLETVYDARPTF